MWLISNFVSLRGAAFSFFPERDKAGVFHLVEALHLLDHQLGVRDDAQTLGFILEGPIEDCQQRGVLGVIIGLLAQVFAQTGDDAALRVFNDCAKAGRAGVAAGAAVTVGGVPGRGIRGLGAHFRK